MLYIVYNKKIKGNKMFTKLEQKVIDSIQYGDDFEEMPTMGAREISQLTRISMKELRGVLSSLLKKNILLEGEYPDGETAFHYQGVK